MYLTYLLSNCNKYSYAVHKSDMQYNFFYYANIVQ